MSPEDSGFASWCRWIDAQVAETPWQIAIAPWVGIAICLLLG